MDFNREVVAWVKNLVHTKENEYELKRQDGFANSCY